MATPCPSRNLASRWCLPCTDQELAAAAKNEWSSAYTHKMEVPSHGESKTVEPPPAKKPRVERSSLMTKFVVDNEANADKVLAQEIVDYVQYEKDAMDKFLKEEADVTHDMVKMLCESVASTTRLRFQARASTASIIVSTISQGYESSAVVFTEDEGTKRLDMGHIAEIARAEASANTDAVKLLRDLIDETRRNRLNFYLNLTTDRFSFLAKAFKFSPSRTFSEDEAGLNSTHQSPQVVVNDEE